MRIVTPGQEDADGVGRPPEETCPGGGGDALYSASQLILGRYGVLLWVPWWALGANKAYVLHMGATSDLVCVLPWQAC